MDGFELVDFVVPEVVLLVFAWEANAWSDVGEMISIAINTKALRTPIVFCMVIRSHTEKKYKTNVRRFSNHFNFS